MSLKNSFKQLKVKLLLSRPYTLASVIALGFVSYFLANGIENIPSVKVTILAASVWLFSMYFGEFLHNTTNENRPKIDFIFPLTFFLILLWHSFTNPNFFIVLLFLSISILLYSLKTKNTLISPFAFVFRGMVELSVIFLFLPLIELENFRMSIFLISIYLLTISRNLIGDLRDKDNDKYTFPKKYGNNLTLLISAISLISVISLNFEISFPLVFILFFTLISKNSYLVHHLYVLSTFFFLINYIFILIGYDAILSNLIFIGMLMNYTYHFVPRKSNKQFEKIL